MRTSASSLAVVWIAFTGLVNAGPIYKCKDSAGNWTEAACIGMAAPKPSDYAIAEQSKIDEQKKADERQRKWEQLCASEGGNWGGECSARQRDDFEHMMSVFKESTKGSEQAAKVSTCLVKWIHGATDTIDATMWRYCYYH